MKALVGGAPVTESYASENGADGYTEDAISTVDIAFRLIDAPISFKSGRRVPIPNYDPVQED
jgi:hypothetical protein